MVMVMMLVTLGSKQTLATHAHQTQRERLLSGQSDQT